MPVSATVATASACGMIGDEVSSVRAGAHRPVSSLQPSSLALCGERLVDEHVQCRVVGRRCRRLDEAIDKKLGLVQHLCPQLGNELTVEAGAFFHNRASTSRSSLLEVNGAVCPDAMCSTRPSTRPWSKSVDVRKCTTNAPMELSSVITVARTRRSVDSRSGWAAYPDRSTRRTAPATAAGGVT